MKRRLVSVLSMILTLLLVACNSETTIVTTIQNREFQITVYTTTGDQSKLLEKQNDLTLKKNTTNAPGTIISLNGNETYQEMDGFGAALTESSAVLINNLDSEKREEVIKNLFSVEDGIGISFVRLPMGASDFATNSYTYNDMPSGSTDLNLDNFSISRDQDNVIPVLKDAFALNSDIKLIGSPWSAPAWMKANGSLNGGSIKGEYIEAYSNYFIKFINAYKNEGLPIYAVTLQNEPLHETPNYPSMKMTAKQQIYFIKQLGPKLDLNNLETKIIAYDHNWDQTGYPLAVLADREASQYVSGSAFHCYGGEVSNQKSIYENYPDKGIWFTECSGGRWAEDFASNMSWNMENVFMGSINHFSKSVLLWNLALNENDGPKNGGCQDCRGVLSINSDGTIKKNEEYYMIGHFSKFVTPGAYRIGTNVIGNDSIISTAFKNPNGDIVVVAHNKGNAINIKLQYDGLESQYNIPARSTNTFIINIE